MSSVSLPWREFTYPLNVFMHILMHEEGGVSALHYGLYEREGESLAEAQEHSTELLLSRLPSPPARILDVGMGLGTTLARLAALGYDAEGITPDVQQLAMARQRHADLRVHAAAFESFEPLMPYDVVVFQESSQYIDSDRLFARAVALTKRIVVLDEFALKPLDEPGALHSLAHFKDAAARHGFAIVEELDVSAKAAPTMEYFADRIAAYRERLIADLGLTNAQIDELIASGAKYRARYADGTYGYRLLRLEIR